MLTQGFDDAATLQGRFKLLDSFEGLLERPIIQDELEKKHLQLVKSYHEDLKQTQEVFLSQRQDPPISSNMPPMCGALRWCRSLKDRIDIPKAKLDALGKNKAIMEREEAKEVLKVYNTIDANLSEYIQSKFEEWGAGVGNLSKEKLKLPLLKRDPETRLLTVNFDAALKRQVRWACG